MRHARPVRGFRRAATRCVAALVVTFVSISGARSGEAATNYRSIGTALNLTNEGTINVTSGSATVTKGGGASWLVANRGRGDVLVVGPNTYTILDVVGDNTLTLTAPAPASFTGPLYTIARQFTTLQAWEDCIDDGPCPIATPTSSDYTVDDRSEVGLAYKDSVFDLSGDVRIDGSITDATHTITLTAGPGNRHHGTVGHGVVIDLQNTSSTGFSIEIADGFVTLKWLEVTGAREDEVVRIEDITEPSPITVLQNLLIHDFFVSGSTNVDGIRVRGAVGTVIVRNTMIWDGDKYGIFGDSGTSLVIENCSIHDIRDAGRGIDSNGSSATVTNTIVTGSTDEDFRGTFNAASSHNISSDDTAPGANELWGVSAANVFVDSVGPVYNLHLKLAPNPALDSGVDLSAAGFQIDVDGDRRPAGAVWDRGADEVTSTGVRFLTITSTSETNVLEWLNPSASYVSTEIVYRTDRYPSDLGDGTSIYDAGTAGTKDRLVHFETFPTSGIPLTNAQTYYYAAFVHRSAAPAVSERQVGTGRPFDNTAPEPVKWAFSAGAFSITPPTVGSAGILAPANDRVLYAMQRGPDPPGGEWPPGWTPVRLGGVVQSRPPIIPIPVSGSNPVVYLGAQDGRIYVADATQGSAVPFPWAPRTIAGVVQAAPAGIFSAFGGAHDYLLVGTRDGAADNTFVALNPDTPGDILGTFDNGGTPSGIGIINGMAAVDYATSRVYFASRENPAGSDSTLWCLQMGPPGPVLDVVWQLPLGDIDGSPVLRGDRVYIGGYDPLDATPDFGTVYSIDTGTGGDVRAFAHGDGPVKGFVWPDRASTDLYFATDTRVWGVSDTGGASMTNKFTLDITLSGGAFPSTVLFVPGSHYVYVGGSDGRLHELDVSTAPALPTQKAVVLGDGLATVGAPSLDIGHGLIHVGTEAGIFYAVQVPLP